ncbi:MAG: hypothetical protein JEY97_00945 [Bacteroidales bacterium]|nr:hypothetical protein [Bacteroidales bacterium]
MNSFILLVKQKTVYVHFDQILQSGKLVITNSRGNTVFREKLTDSFFEVITLEQPEGKYCIKIDSDKIKTKKSFNLK